MLNMNKSAIWAIASGKGGVGKSFFTSNLSIDLAQKDKNVVAIDADFGGPNLHTFFNPYTSKISISDFINNPQIRLDDVLLPTGFTNLKLASGSHDTFDLANPTLKQQHKFQKALETLNADYVIVDLGAGTSHHTLDLFLMANKSILVTIPEPTSVENAYRFIKSAIYRKLKSVIQNPEVKRLLESMTEKKQGYRFRTPSQLVNDINKIDTKAGNRIRHELATFRPKLVVNQIRTLSDVKIGFSMRQACLKYFGIKLEYTGFIEHDKSVLRSIRARQPVILYAPKSPASNSVRKIAHNMRYNYHLISNG